MKAVLLGCALAAASWPALAQDAGALATRSLAATCATCHGTDGRPAAGSRMPVLAGEARDRLLQRLRGFRDGTRASTVMQQIALGFSDAQLQQLASYFAAQPR